MLIICVVFVFCNGLVAQEICTNGIDDDGDGLIDLNDNECACNGINSGFQLRPDLIPNASFESNSCCPDGLNFETNYIDCLDDWTPIFGGGTPDYHNNCDWVLDGCPLPIPDGNGCAGLWSNNDFKEYVGICLDGIILSNESHFPFLGRPIVHPFQQLPLRIVHLKILVGRK